MRETKFRARSLRSAEWVYGSLVVYSKPDTTPDIYDPETSQFIAVDRETVGEYIGLHDKNGVHEIYEGDILSKPHIRSTYGVKRDYGFQTRVVTWRKTASVTGWNLSDRHSLLYKVVGNIYENPELLGLGMSLVA